ncbi:MAG: glycerophosphodiester phosphodiesterase [Actinobacteria bacterium]|nr:glycerophosphodiester phosphodiesterase [Actinomycetota bacterium]
MSAVDAGRPGRRRGADPTSGRPVCSWRLETPWTRRRVIAYAHQGGAWEAPSSTLYAIERAVEGGATGIELDVHATADGHLVVCHDSTVDRTTGGSGAISELSLEEVLLLDNGYRFTPGSDAAVGLPESSYPFRGRAPADHAFGVATLTEVLELLSAHPGVVLNLDIKATAPAVRPYEEALARVLAEHGRADGVIVASFLDQATEAFSKLAPHVATSAGTLGVAEFWRALREGVEPPAMRHVALQVPATRGDLVVVDEDFVEVAHAHGLAVHVWTVNDEQEMARLVELGVDGIITDIPSVLVALLDRMGVAWHP